MNSIDMHVLAEAAHQDKLAEESYAEYAAMTSEQRAAIPMLDWGDLAQDPKPCPCGEPAFAYGYCRPCWNALSVSQRGDAIKALYPSVGRPPNRRLEWRAR